MLGFDGIFKDRRERQYKWVSATGWLGLEWEIVINVIFIL